MYTTEVYDVHAMLYSRLYRYVSGAYYRDMSSAYDHAHRFNRKAQNCLLYISMHNAAAISDKLALCDAAVAYLAQHQHYVVTHWMHHCDITSAV
eukprot:18456-Heterococcus_DN1.PRE.2